MTTHTDNTQINKIPLIYLIKSDKTQEDPINQALIDNGYNLQLFTEADAFFRSACASPDIEKPSAVIMDITFSGDDISASFINDLNLCNTHNIPVIVTSEREDLTSRLLALRAGAHNYFHKPVDISRLTDHLDEITKHKQKEPYRILLVDDDRALLEFHGNILSEAGMLVETLSEPLKTLDVVNRFAPDVVMLDMYMPDANGAEIVTVLRDSGYQLPVLFLSSENDSSIQMTALERGGDDFLIKPVSPEQLITTIRTRAQRSRNSIAVCKKLESTLYEHDRVQHALNIHALVSITDKSGNIIYANDQFCDVSGYSRNELLGQNHRIIKSGLHSPEFYQDIWHTITSGKIWQGEVCNRSKNGNLYWMESTITPFLDTMGKPYQYVSIRTDITHKKDKERILKSIVEGTSQLKSETIYEQAVKGLAEAMRVKICFIAQRNKHDDSMFETVAFWNTDRIENNFSYPVANTPCEKVLHRENTIYPENVAEIFPEDLWLKENDIESYIGFPLINSNGIVLGQIAVMNDKALDNVDEKLELMKVFITRIVGEIERTQIDNELRLNEHKYRTLAENIPGMVYRGKPDWSVEYISNCEEISGYSNEELQRESTNWINIIHPGDKSKVLDESAVLPKKQCILTQQYRIHHKNGEVRWVSDHKQSLFIDGSYAGVDGVVFDISDKVKAEQDAVILRERLRRGQIFANIGTWEWQIQSGELVWTERIAPLFGYPEGNLETTYENFLAAVHPDDRQLVIDAVNACVEKDEPYDIEHRVVWPDGTVRWLQERGAVSRDDDGNPVQMLGVVQDIDDRKQAELALIDSEHQLRDAQTMAHVGNWHADLTTGSLRWSDEIYRIFGYEPRSFIPSVEIFTSAVHPSDLEKVRESEKIAAKTGYHDVIHRIVRPDGSVRHVHELAQAKVSADGNIISLTGTVQDVTEQIEAEALLAENEEKFRSLYEQSPVGIALTDVDGHFIEANKGFLDILGYSFEELSELSYWQVTPEEYASQEAKQLEDLNTSGRYGPYEKEYIHKNGYLVDVLLNGSIVHDREGNKRIWSIVQNLSEQKQANMALNRFKTTLDMTRDSTFMFEPVNLRFFYVNQSAIDEFGYSESELMNMTPYDIKPDYDETQFRQLIKPLIEGDTAGMTFETVHQHKNGARIPVEISLQYISPENESSRFVAIVRNITERKQNEAAIKESQQRMALHVQRTPLGVIEWDNNFCVKEWNSAAQSIFEYSREDALGHHPTELIIPENAFDQVGDIWEQLLTLQGGLRSNNENITKSGKVIFCEWYNTPLIDDDGKVIGVASLVQDITKQRNAEMELIQAKQEAEYANKAKSEFLSSMSHELRTPMNAILGFSQLLQLEENISDEQKDNVNEIIKAGSHLLNLINEVLDLAKVESGQIDLSLESVDVCLIIDDCFNLIKTLADNRNITVTHSCLDSLAVRADYTRLKQALLNLLSNAIKYNHENGSISVDVKLTDEQNLRILVIDTGLGIPEKRLAELFQPFNRLDAEDSNIEGTGIGLTITQRIVEMMGGSIGVESEVDKGSTFWIELPYEASTKFKNNQSKISADLNSEDTNVEHTVLYIEDNPANLRLVAQILGSRKNIKLLTAHTPSLGIELALARKPELILLDINMPGMDGYQVLEIFKADESLKDIPIVAVTANAMQIDIDNGKQAGFTEYITKPLDIPRFIKIVDKCL